jgi:hypothetical protein
VKLLLAKGAEVNAQDKRGRTALIVASKDGYREVVQILLAYGADVNGRDKKGNTALDWASFSGYGVSPKPDIQEMLMKAGAKKSWRPYLPTWLRYYAPKLTLNMVIVSLVILLVGGLWLWKKWRARGRVPGV